MAALLFVLIDLVLVAATVQGIGWGFHEYLFPDAPYGFVGATVNSTSILLLTIFGNYAVSLYDREVLVTRLGLLSRVVVATVGAIIGGLLIQYFVWYMPNGRIIVVTQAFALGSVSLAWRYVLSTIYRDAPKRRVAVYGTPFVCAEVDRILREQAFCAYEIQYFVESREASTEGDSAVELRADIQQLASLDALVGVESEAPEVLLMGHQGALRTSAMGPMTKLRDRGVRPRSAAAFVSDLAGFIPIDLASVDWVVGALDRVHQRSSLPLKRALDVSVSLAGILVMVLLSPLLFVLTKYRSPGPLFYSQERVGLGGEVFTIYKFRSMTQASTTAGKWADQEKARISPGGHVLRQSRLDELPQFWNVLRGEMSVVGPRPEQPSITETLQQSIEFLHYRYAVKPGITGWQQVKQGYVITEEGWMKRLTYDLYYVQNFGVLFDIEIMVKTAFIMLARIRSH